MSRPYRYLSFVPFRPATFHVVAVVPLSATLLSFDPYRSTPLSLGIGHILVRFSLLLPPLY
jgi:hypothetical protein